MPDIVELVDGMEWHQYAALKEDRELEIERKQSAALQKELDQAQLLRRDEEKGYWAKRGAVRAAATSAEREAERKGNMFSTHLGAGVWLTMTVGLAEQTIEAFGREHRRGGTLHHQMVSFLKPLLDAGIIKLV